MCKCLCVWAGVLTRKNEPPIGLAPAALMLFPPSSLLRQTALKSLRSRLSSAFEASLEAAGWPPALGSPSPAFTPEALKSLYELAGYLTEAQKAAEPQSFPPGIEVRLLQLQLLSCLHYFLLPILCLLLLPS